MAQETLLLLVIGGAILAALVGLWRLRPSSAQGLWIGGGVVVGVFVMLGAAAWGYRMPGGGIAFVFMLGGAFVGWLITLLFRIK
jgi:hypothetical protein